jgi:hypothetical protein
MQAGNPLGNGAHEADISKHPQLHHLQLQVLAQLGYNYLHPAALYVTKFVSDQHHFASAHDYWYW